MNGIWGERKGREDWEEKRREKQSTHVLGHLDHTVHVAIYVYLAHNTGEEFTSVETRGSFLIMNTMTLYTHSGRPQYIVLAIMLALNN